MEKKLDKKENIEKNSFKNKNFFTAIKYALSGLKEIFLSERNIRIQTLFAFVILIFSIVFEISFVEVMIVFISIFFVIFSEIVNTMVEKILDLYTKNKNDEVGLIKDIAAGAVLFSVASSIIVGLFIFVPRIIDFINKIN